MEVQQGWVTLEGEVNWYYQRHAAEHTIELLLGVKGVSNLIRVKSRVLAQDVSNKIVKALKRSAVVEAQ